jgi:hypothetical protein
VVPVGTYWRCEECRWEGSKPDAGGGPAPPIANFRRAASRVGASLIIGLGVLFGLAALGLLGLEAVGYLRRGDWLVSLRLQDVVMLALSAKRAQWIVAPTDWFGLHAIVLPVLKMPLWLPAGVVAAGCIGCGVHDLLWASIYDSLDARRPERK